MQIQLCNQSKQPVAQSLLAGGEQLADGAFLLQLAASTDENGLNGLHKLQSNSVALQVDVHRPVDNVSVDGLSQLLSDKVNGLAGFLSTDFLMNPQTRQPFEPEFLSYDLSTAAVQVGQSRNKLIHKSGVTYWGFCASGRFTTDEYSAQILTQYSADQWPVLSARAGGIKPDLQPARLLQQWNIVRPEQPFITGAAQLQRQTEADIAAADETFYVLQSPAFSQEWQKEMLKIQLSAGQAVVFYRNFAESQHSTLAALQDWFDRQALQHVYWYVNGVASQGRAQSGS